MELLTGLALVGTAAGLLHWVSSRRTVALLDLFGKGFLPYRSDDAWPQGVQEADPVPWSWTPAADPALTADLPDDGSGDVEVIEITRAPVAIAIPVHREPLRPGSASRPH